MSEFKKYRRKKWITTAVYVATGSFALMAIQRPDEIKYLMIGAILGLIMGGGGLSVTNVDRNDREQLVAKVSGRDLAFILQKRSNQTTTT